MSPHITQWLTSVKRREDFEILPTSVVFTNQSPQKVAEKDILFDLWDTIDYKLASNNGWGTRQEMAIRQALRLIFTHEEIPPEYLKMLDEIEEPTILTDEQKKALQDKKMERCIEAGCGTKHRPCAKHRCCQIHTDCGLTVSVVRYIHVRCQKCKEEKGRRFSAYVPRYQHDEIRKLRMNPFCSVHTSMMLDFKWKFSVVEKCFHCTIQGW